MDEQETQAKKSGFICNDEYHLKIKILILFLRKCIIR